MDTRDPRVDPRPGDVVRLPHEDDDRWLVREVVSGVVRYSVRRWLGIRYLRHHTTTLRAWRRDCATATVITVAGEEGR